MYEVTLTIDEMAELARVAREYRDNFDDYPGSQMVLTNGPDFTAAADSFLSVFGKGDVPPLPETAPTKPRSLGRLEIEIFRTGDGHFQMRCGGAIGILASTAVAYEESMVQDPSVKRRLGTIQEKFLDQSDIRAARAQ